jgi:FkbM family methyltransferase
VRDRSALLKRLTEWRPVGRALGAILVSRRLVESGRFLARELPRSRVRGCYTLRESGLKVWLRHSTPDVQNFDEIFYQRLYDPPPGIEDRLRGGRVVDLGANIGLAGAYFLGTLGASAVVGVEPDPANLEVHAATIAANAMGERWRLVPGFAAPSAGSVSFAAGRFAESRQARAGEPGAVDVESVDVFPELEEADTIKIDVEGAEWALLQDPRFAKLRASVVVLEYHAHLCQEPDPRALADRLLSEAGYETASVFEDPDGTGMMWAWRPA